MIMKKYIAADSETCCAKCVNYTPITRSKNGEFEYGFCKTHNFHNEVVIENTASHFTCKKKFVDVNAK